MRETGAVPSDGASEGGSGAMHDEHRLLARSVRWVAWLRASPRRVIVLTVACMAGAFVLDLSIPGYAIAGFYLIPILLAAFALPGRIAALVGGLALGLAVLVMVIQDRVDLQNVLLLWFATLVAVGLFALAYLYNRFDQLYETERRMTSRLHALTAELRALQETAVLDQAASPAILPARIAEQSLRLLGSDLCALYRLEDDGSPVVEARAGASPPEGSDDDEALRGAAAQAVRRRQAFVDGERLAVPLAVRDEVFGAIVLSDHDRRTYHEEDISIATTFGDQAALAIENTRLRGRLERDAAAAERSRLARELHDSVTQSLFAASLKADVVAETCVAPTPRVEQALEDLRHLTRGALAEMRTLLLEVRPDSVLRTPLAELLRQLVEAARGRARLAVELEAGSVRALPDAVHITFYRVAQEALNNVVRHAGASAARVVLGDDGAVVLTVADDGAGFDTGEASRGRLGIISMRERAASVDADLTIETAPGRGTVVTLTWPGDERGRSADGP